MDQKNPFLFKSFVSLIVILFGVTLFCLFYFAMRGLDITDDGNYLISARYPDEVIGNVSSFHYLIGALFKMLGFRVIVLRWLCVFCIGASAVALGSKVAGVLRLFRKEENPFFIQAVCMAFTGLGALLYFSRGGLYTPSYNTLIAIAVNLSAFLFLEYCRLIFNQSKGLQKIPLLLLFQGLLIGICLLVKAPTGMLLLLFWFIVLLFLKPGGANIFTTLFAVIAGMALNFLIYFLFIQNFQDWSSKYSIALQVLRSAGHDPHELLVQYFHDARFHFLYMLDNFSLFILLFLGITKAEHSFKDRMNFFIKNANIIFLSFLLLVALVFALNGYFLISGPGIFFVFQFYFFWILLALGLVMLFPMDKKIAAMLIGLVFFPLAGTVGTNNGLFVNIMMNLAPWFACFILIFLSSSGLIERWAGFILFIISLFASSQIISSAILTPYRLHTGILWQNTPVRLGEPADTFLLDRDTAGFFIHVKSIAMTCGLRPGDDMMAFSDMPGLVYALGARPPGTAWWYSYPYSGLSSNKCKANSDYILHLIPAFRVKRAYILKKVSPWTIIPDMTAKGMDFPKNYQLCGQAAWPLDHEIVQLWKPK